MSHRQSGAAHVPIMLFLILLVLFLGALGFAYISTDANTNLTTQAATLREDLRVDRGRRVLRDHYIEDLGNVVKLPGKYTQRPEVDASTYANTTLEGVEGVIDPKDLKRRMDEFGSRIGVATTNGLDDLFTAVGGKFEQLNQRIKDLEMERDRILSEKSAIEANFTKAGNEHSAAASQWRQDLEQINAEFTNAKTAKDNTITGLQENLRTEKDRYQTTQEEYAKEKKGLQNDIGRLQMHNTALTSREKLRQPADVADGKILGARSGLDTAYVNIGRKDLLQPGTIFRVRNRNSEAVKAYATVTRVENDKAEVRLSNVADPIGDAVREGDLIYNELYTPGMRRVIYLMGDFRYPYNKDQLKRLLENLGNDVVGTMRPGVDTVILGDNSINEAGDDFTNLKETDEYKEAVFLGVEFAPLRKVRDLIKL